jgi:ribosomal protein L7Ae-like RNA K-turn-binding protein
MSDRALGLLGLAARARALTIGTGATRAGLQRGVVRLVVLAADRSPRTEEKVQRLASGTGVPMMEGPPATVLGNRLGRGAVQAVGVMEATLAAGLLATQAGRS